MSSVTLASCAISAPGMRHASARISFVNVIKCPFRLSGAIPCVVRIGWYVAVSLVPCEILSAQLLLDVAAILRVTKQVQNDSELCNLACA